MTAIWWIRGGAAKRDMDAAKPFFTRAVAVVGHAPASVTTDGHHSSPRALHATRGTEAIDRTQVYLNNRIEQDQRGIKQWSYPIMVLETSRQQHAAVVPLMNSVSICAPVPEKEKRSDWRTNGSESVNDCWLCKN